MLRHVVSSGVGLFVVLSLWVAVTYPQALRPYDPPSIRNPQYQQSQPLAPSMRPTVDEAVYERFRADVQKLEPTARKKLAEVLQQQLQQARQEGRYEEVRYNERLLGILESIR